MARAATASLGRRTGALPTSTYVGDEFADMQEGDTTREIFRRSVTKHGVRDCIKMCSGEFRRQLREFRPQACARSSSVPSMRSDSEAPGKSCFRNQGRLHMHQPADPLIEFELGAAFDLVVQRVDLGI